MPYKRRRTWRSFWGDDTSGVDLRHGRALSINDNAVMQVSQYEWVVKSATTGGQQYTVTFDEDLAEEVEDRDNEFCEACTEDYDDEESNENYCSNCDICACYYTCTCPDDHGLCKHIQKVHSMTKRLIDEQGPKTLEKVIEETVAKFSAVCKQVLKHRDNNQAEKEELLADLEAVVYKYCDL